MKRFELTIHCRSSKNENKFIWHDTLQADSLIELFSKLLISTAQMNEVIKEEEDRYRIGVDVDDDDIPF